MRAYHKFIAKKTRLRAKLRCGLFRIGVVDMILKYKDGRWIYDTWIGGQK